MSKISQLKLNMGQIQIPSYLCEKMRLERIVTPPPKKLTFFHILNKRFQF